MTTKKTKETKTTKNKKTTTKPKTTKKVVKEEPVIEEVEVAETEETSDVTCNEEKQVTEPVEEDMEEEVISATIEGNNVVLEQENGNVVEIEVPSLIQEETKDLPMDVLDDILKHHETATTVEKKIVEVEKKEVKPKNKWFGQRKFSWMGKIFDI